MRSSGFALVLCALATGCSSFSPNGPEPNQVAQAKFKSESFHVIAHRGGAGLAPENTLPAVRRSLALGIYEVELDLRLSRDEVLILFHDADLGRKTDRHGSVSNYTAAELRATEIGRWFDREHPGFSESFSGTTLARLTDLFDEFGSRLYYHLEIKGEDARIPARLLRRIDEYDLRSRVTVTSFSRAQLAQFRSLAPEAPVCWLLKRNRSTREIASKQDEMPKAQRRAIDSAVAAGFDQIGVAADELSAEVVRYAHDQGLGIRAWGLKTREHVERVIESGSDGATTDWPDVLRERLDQLQGTL